MIDDMSTLDSTSASQQPPAPSVLACSGQGAFLSGGGTQSTDARAGDWVGGGHCSSVGSTPTLPIFVCAWGNDG